MATGERLPGFGDSVLDAIGNTPVVKLGRFAADLGRDIYAKLEYLNPGGSHKARIALNMVLDAERQGVLARHTGQTLVEATGGNTGIGLAMASAVLGYRLVLVIPDNYSQAKQRLLRAYGAQVILSDHRRGNNSHNELAMRLLLRNPDWIMLNQFVNPANPAAHEDHTAQEIIATFGGDLPDAMVAGIGTGGHLTGIGRVLRKHKPDMRIAAVVPEGCSILEDRFVTHAIQGLAVGIVPDILDTGLIDDEIAVSGDEAVAMMGRLMRTEGLAVGVSSAANAVAAARYAGQLPAGAKVLTFAYDGIQEYLGMLEG
jgi:cysteine synthase